MTAVVFLSQSNLLTQIWSVFHGRRLLTNRTGKRLPSRALVGTGPRQLMNLTNQGTVSKINPFYCNYLKKK